MTVLSAGAAMPIMLAGAGLGLASGVTGGAAAITNKVLSSQQMTEVETAMEVDSAATCELEQEVDKVRLTNGNRSCHGLRSCNQKCECVTVLSLR